MRKRIVIMTAAITGTVALAGCTSKNSGSVVVTPLPTASAQAGENNVPEGTPPSGKPPEGTPPGQPQDAQGGRGAGQDSANVTTTGVQTIDGETKTLKEGSVTSSNDNESTFKVTNEGVLNLTGYTLTKESGETSSTDASDFYGANAGILTNEGSTTTIKDSTITTNAKGGNAVFSTGEGSNVTLDNVTITTSQNNSRGLDATYSGTITANKVTITTKGAHCAAVATDRGEGTVSVTNSKLNTSGEGSPCIYSTGTITAENTTGEASGSLLAAVEGKNSITLKGCTFTGSGQGRATGGIDDSGVMIYQSMSGDAGEGTGSFTAEDSSLSILTSSSNYKTSPMFFVTNTDAVINLTNTKLDFGSGVLLEASGNSGEWGNAGENGGNVTMTATNQTLIGSIAADEISTISLTLTKSTLESALNTDNQAKSITVTMDSESVWTLSGDSYVTAFTDDDTELSNIKSNGHNIYYDASNSANSWLNGKTISLSGGGSITPKEE